MDNEIEYSDGRSAHCGVLAQQKSVNVEVVVPWRHKCACHLCDRLLHIRLEQRDIHGVDGAEAYTAQRAGGDVKLGHLDEGEQRVADKWGRWREEKTKAQSSAQLQDIDEHRDLGSTEALHSPSEVGQHVQSSSSPGHLARVGVCERNFVVDEEALAQLVFLSLLVDIIARLFGIPVHAVGGPIVLLLSTSMAQPPNDAVTFLHALLLAFEVGQLAGPGDRAWLARCSRCSRGPTLRLA